VRRIGVVPAAGRAVRMQPLAGSKELLDVGGRPVLEHVVERLRAARADEIRVVTRPDKQDVIAYATRLGATAIVGEPPSSAESVLLAVRGLSADDVAMIGFPDTVWTSATGFSALTALLANDADVALGLFRGRDEAQLRRSDVVVLTGSRVEAVLVKPERPGSELLWGCAAARVGALDGLAGREHPGDLFAELAREGRVAGVLLDGEFLDIGTPADLAAARS
jgi:NDP-sugar pyrophosphorylase family protein